MLKIVWCRKWKCSHYAVFVKFLLFLWLFYFWAFITAKGKPNSPSLIWSMIDTKAFLLHLKIFKKIAYFKCNFPPAQHLVDYLILYLKRKVYRGLSKIYEHVKFLNDTSFQNAFYYCQIIYSFLSDSLIINWFFDLIYFVSWLTANIA